MSRKVKRINEALRQPLDKILETATDCRDGNISDKRLLAYIIAETDKAISLCSRLIISRPNDILRATLEEISAEGKQEGQNVSPDRIIFLADTALQLYAYDLINRSEK